MADSFTAETMARHGSSWWGEDEMRDFLSDTLEIGLGAYSPRLFTDQLDERRSADRGELRLRLSVWNDCFSDCCLELFNYIAEGAVYKVCANQPCGRWFLRQQVRAVHEQRRMSGVRFCSHRCARAHTQRERRYACRPADAQGLAVRGLEVEVSCRPAITRVRAPGPPFVPR